ncbi:MAG: NAD(P)-dependent alcohol dehydrogenase [Gemmatimonadaceae bacterium]|nr:NAD(P)-dependent alcohol dehydrogenase [Acetobacteraceae bacterium]
MHAIELTAPRLDAFRSATLPDPRPPQVGEALIRLRAASLNFLDVAVATGGFPVPGFPVVPVTDGAGEVVEVGEGVDGLAVGDRVVPHFMPRWQGGAITPEGTAAMRGVTLPGSLAEYAVLPASSLVHAPRHLGWEHLAALPIAATTAWRAVRTASLGPGKTALLLGTGGVSVFALQFAKAHGARVIVTSSSDAKLDRARLLGADEGINYRATPEWDREALRLTDGRGADLVLETGGADTFARSLGAVATGGTVFVIGILSGLRPTIDVLPIIAKGVRVQGNNTGSVADLREAGAAIETHRIEPVVDRIFAMDEAADAYAHLAAGGRHFGKLAIAVG